MMSGDIQNFYDGNIGENNNGCFNTGDNNTGVSNIGIANKGVNNIGNRNRGDHNVGNGNVGHYNIGNCNIGDHCVGLFNTQPTPLYLFNKPCNLTWEDLRAMGILSDVECLDYETASQLPNFNLDIWNEYRKSQKLSTK